jgi:hypothetical protein
MPTGKPPQICGQEPGYSMVGSSAQVSPDWRLGVGLGCILTGGLTGNGSIPILWSEFGSTQLED